MEINPRDIELKIFASRPTIELGEAYEIFLKIHNFSKQGIWIVDLATTLALPAEIRHPSEFKVRSQGASFPTLSGQGVECIFIPAGSEYVVHWRLNHDIEEDSKLSFLHNSLWHIFFHPGNYTVQAATHIWLEKPDLSVLSAPKLLENGFRERIAEGENVQDVFKEVSEKRNDQVDAMGHSVPFSVSGEIEFSVKSVTTFFAAAFGGLAAFLLKQLGLLSHGVDTSWNDLFLLPMYMLSAIVLTLLVSRISEAKLPFTVKIMDFWGAMAVGIASGFLGNSLINAFILNIEKL